MARGKLWPENASLSKEEEEALKKCKQEISSYDKCVKRKKFLLVGDCHKREQVMKNCLRQWYMESNNAVNQKGKAQPNVE